MAKDYSGKYVTKVQAAANALTSAGSNVFYGRRAITAYTSVISTTAVKSDSVILVTFQCAQTSVAYAGSYSTLPTFFVTSINDSVAFSIQTVTASNAGNLLTSSYTAMWMIANPA